MTSDINGNVTGIQGNPISSTNPEDGYVLTWNATDGYWVAQPPKTTLFQKQVFTSNGSWTAPPGVTSVTLIGYGGGGGGGAGCKTSGTGDVHGGPGGGGSLQTTTTVDVVPGVTYSISIGAGGAGGISNNNVSGTKGEDGYDTKFDSLATFIGAGGAYNGENTYAFGGLSVRASSGSTFHYARAGIYNTSSDTFSIGGPAYGAPGGEYGDSFFFKEGFANPLGYAGGSNGLTATRFGGGGGGGGPGGVGGNGSDGSVTTSLDGESGNPNTGSGGGGSGAANTNVGNGGSGGSGKLWVLWVENK